VTLRLHLLCAASSTRVVGFPADDGLDSLGRESLSRFSGRLPAMDRLLRSPALSAAQTTDGLGLRAEVEPLLRDCDFGRWAGRSLEEIAAREPDALDQWLRDPGAAPHGGVAFAEVLKRVGAWMDGLDAQSGSVLAITHPTVLRAAIAWTLGAGAHSMLPIDVAPLTIVRLSGFGGRWKFKALIPAKDAR
jgi:broad specificity phosphatase PhoE